MQTLIAKILGKKTNSVNSVYIEPVTGLKTSNSENPYLSARREWNERYGDYISRTRTWQFVAILSVAISGVLGTALVYVAGQSKVQPFIVKVDKLGQAVAVGSAEKAGRSDETIIRYQLANFITNVRSVTPDGIVQRRFLDSAYSICTANATEYLNSYFTSKDKAHDPWEIAKSSIIAVEIHSAIPLSDKSWEILWTESKRGLSGGVIDETRWKAIINIASFIPKTQEQIIKNPTGVIIDHITWTQQL